MLESDNNPNVLAFNTFIKGMCLVGRFSDTLSWNHVMENMGYALHIDSCSIRLHRLCNSGYVNEATKVLQSMVNTSIFYVDIGYLNRAGNMRKH